MPTLAEALAIALAHHRAGRLDVAEEIYRRVLAAEPDHAPALHLLGVIAHQTGRHAVAVERIRQAVALEPGNSAYHSNLGEAYRSLQRYAEAVACYRQALELDPHMAKAHFNLGNVLSLQGRADEAIAAYRRALELRPEVAEWHSNLGVVFQSQARLAEAADCFRQAIALRPDFAEAHSNLGIALYLALNYDEAAACFRRAIELQPGLALAHNNLGLALQEQGKPDEAIACYERALQLAPDYATARSALLVTMQYRHGVGLPELAAAHGEYERRHAAGLRSVWRPHSNRPEAERPLRLGFVSSDLGQHPVGSFLLPVLENLERSQFAAVCYSGRRVADAISDRLKASSALWHEVADWTDEQLAEQIRADGIDMCFDLAGHTTGNRLLAFARKPAPIQITWLGYVGTTGLAAIDYLLADRYEIPAEAEPFYCESVLRMPDGYVCFAPPADAPPVAALPALREGHVTFGCFSNPAKITSPMIGVWAEILGRVRGSRLAFKFRGLEGDAARRRLVEQFAAYAVSADRLDLWGWSPRGELLDHYGRIDLALDTLPYNGGLTTCEALWMGVPVITCPGETFAGRHSLSHLSNAGLVETIAADLDAYVDIAVRLATDLGRLSQLRAGLREQVRRSPLCDGRRFAWNLAALLREAWRTWCGGESRQNT
jgi:predicted O-linked N-acetylglucosamine transferase (SPINDLY family)